MLFLKLGCLTLVEGRGGGDVAGVDRPIEHHAGYPPLVLTGLFRVEEAALLHVFRVNVREGQAVGLDFLVHELGRDGQVLCSHPLQRHLAAVVVLVIHVFVALKGRRCAQHLLAGLVVEPGRVINPVINTGDCSGIGGEAQSELVLYQGNVEVAIDGKVCASVAD